MKWNKLGLIYSVQSQHPELYSHAANPLPVYLHDNVYRIFFSARNKDNKSSVAYVDIDIVKLNVVNSTQEPVIRYGNNDSFYSHGISIGNCYTGNDSKKYILFMGWQLRNSEHWRGDVGRIELIEDNKMVVNPDYPFLGTDEEDSVSLSYPFVVFHQGIYKMWYGSTVSWTSENGEMIHVIKYATSTDGVKWEKHGIAIPYQIGVAQAFSRPSVIIDNSGYHMWYSYRSGSGTKYRIGYSNSKDGVNWVNKLNETGIDVSEHGWDSEMICYPFVFDHKGERYMLYNGNGYGKEGFGLAKLIK
jgi:hypothetical protein